MHFPQVPDQLAKSADEKIQLLKETWHAMEWLYENGLTSFRTLRHFQTFLGFCRAIGVSNYSQNDLMQLLSYAQVLPHVNQIEHHPYYNPLELVHFCRTRDIVVAVRVETISFQKKASTLQGYCPLAKGRILSEEPILRIANKHRRTPAQICVRWSIDNGVPAIPKSTTRERMRSNAQVFDFHLDDEDMSVLNSLHDEQRKVIHWDDLQVRCFPSRTFTVFFSAQVRPARRLQTAQSDTHCYETGEHLSACIIPVERASKVISVFTYIQSRQYPYQCFNEIFKPTFLYTHAGPPVIYSISNVCFTH